MMDVVKKYLREILGYLLVRFYTITKQSHKGILSIYFHNPSVALFESILKWLSEQGYRCISIKELEYHISQNLVNEKMVFISFDDGWKGNLELIQTIERWKVPVVIFVPTHAVVSGNYWWEFSMIEGQEEYSNIKNTENFKKLSEEIFIEKIEILKQKYQLERSCLSLEELIRISKHEYITIASHSVTHPILSKNSYKTQTWELMESKRILSTWIKQNIEYISYPNGDYNKDTIEIAKKCSYKLGFTTHHGDIIPQKVDPYLIPRNSLNDEGGFYENISKLLGIWQKIF
jgi:peptidoglycan/xylan/chitin deacetylase (PgdA/CDA1 family)